jgi:ribosomal protein S18 acetylase RimI-like enzyme
VERCRPAEPADLERVVALTRELHRELAGMRGGEIWAAREARREPLAAGLAAQLEDPATCVLVGLIDEVIVGYGVVVVEALATGERLGRITDLFVEEPARSVGVGEALSDALLAFTAEHGVIGVDTRALPGHRAAKNFFEEQGFTARALIMHRPVPRR